MAWLALFPSVDAFLTFILRSLDPKVDYFLSFKGMEILPSISRSIKQPWEAILKNEEQ